GYCASELARPVRSRLCAAAGSDHPEVGSHPVDQPRCRHPLCLCRPADKVGVMALADPPSRLSLWRLVWPARVPGGFRRTARVPWIPIAIISVIVVMALFAPLLAPYSPIDQTLRDKLLPPVWMDGGKSKYLLGTDAFGRDVLSRMTYGAPVSLLVA